MRDHPTLASRRGFLRGLGAAVGLPALDLFRPLMAAEDGRRALATTAGGAPLRMAYLQIANEVNLEHWRPSGSTGGYKMGPAFKPMEAHRNDFQIYTGFEQKNASNGGDGPGDHARGVATFLTSSRAHRTAGSDINLGISINQVGAKAVGNQTRLPSLELSAEGVRKSSACDSGNVPLANLYLRMLEEMGINEKRFGDSSGVLKKV